MEQDKGDPNAPKSEPAVEPCNSDKELQTPLSGGEALARSIVGFRPPTQDENIAKFLGDAVSAVATQMGERAESIEKYRTEAAKVQAESSVQVAKSKEVVRIAELKWIVPSVVICSVFIFMLIAFAIWQGKESIATQLVSMGVSLLAGAFGGYGIGVSKKKSE